MTEPCLDVDPDDRAEELLCVLSHRRRTVATTGHVCNQHLADLRDLLADIQDLTEMLPYADRPMVDERNSESKHTKNPDPAAPLNLARLALSDPRNPAVVAVTKERNFNQVSGRLDSNGADIPHLWGVLNSWCDLVADGRNTENTAVSSAELIGMLRRHLTWIVAQDWLRDFEDEMRGLRRGLALAVGDPVSLPKSLCQCPYDGTPLYTDRDRDIIKLRRQGKPPDEATGRADQVCCPDCKASWEGVGMLRLKLMVEQAEQQREAS